MKISIFFQIFFIAQIQVAQQYSSLTTQNNSMAVTGKGMDPQDILNTDRMSVQRTVTNYLEVFGTFWPTWETFRVVTY